MSSRQPSPPSPGVPELVLDAADDQPVVHTTEDLVAMSEPIRPRTLTIDELPIVGQGQAPVQPQTPAQPQRPVQPGAAGRPAAPAALPHPPTLPAAHVEATQKAAPAAPQVVLPDTHAAASGHGSSVSAPNAAGQGAPAQRPLGAHAGGGPVSAHPAKPTTRPAPAPQATPPAPQAHVAPAAQVPPAPQVAPAPQAHVAPAPQAAPPAPHVAPAPQAHVAPAPQQTPPTAPGSATGQPAPQAAAGLHTNYAQQTPAINSPAPPPAATISPAAPTPAALHTPAPTTVPARPPTSSWGEVGPGSSPAQSGTVGPTQELPDRQLANDEELHDSNSILRSTQTMEMRRVLGVDVTVETMSASYARQAPPQVGSINFVAHSGEVLGVVGPSGCGKTTLLRAMLGQIDHHGKILYGSQELDTTGRRDIQQTVSLVNQFDAPESALPLHRYLRFEADRRMPGKTAEERAKAVDEVMVSLQLDHKRDVAVRSLSGGQRKRVSVASALLAKSSVIYLDEPTTGLDPESEIGLLQVLGRLAKHGGHTIIMITHSPAALARCDRLVVLAPRRVGPSGVAFEGTPKNMLAHFKADAVDDVYTLLARAHSEPSSPDWVVQWDEHVTAVGGNTPPDRPGREPEQGHRSWVHPFKQAASQTKQLLAEAIADRRYLMTLFVQPLALMAVLLAVLRFNNLTVSGGPAQFLGFVAVAATLPGLLTASAQVVTERHTLRRDLTIGMSGGAYIVGKFAFLAVVSLVQASLFLAVFIHQGGPDAGALLPIRFVELWLTLFLTCLSVSALGLLVSTMARSEKALQLYIPCLVISQIVFCGAFLAVPGLLLHVSNAVPAFWSFTSMAYTHDLATLANCASAPATSSIPCETTWTQTKWHGFLALGSLLTQIVLFVVGALIAVRALHRDRF